MPNATIGSLATTGTIAIDGLRLPVVVGTYPHERRGPQTVLVDLELTVGCQAACANDDLAAAVDYEALTARLAGAAASTSFQLIEALTAFLLRQVLATDGVEAALVRVTKPAALPAANGVSFALRGARSPSS